MLKSPMKQTQRYSAIPTTDAGETGRIFDAIDWSQHPLGAVENWPASLTTTIATLLNARHPICLFWGPEHTYFYNDGYIPILGDKKHPKAMGQAGQEVWSEVWDLLIPQIDLVTKAGKSTWNEDHLVPVYRDGQVQESYFTYSYSPVFLADGTVGGAIVTCTETTSRVLVERKLQSLNEHLTEALRTRDEFLSIASHELKTPLTALKLQTMLHQRAVVRKGALAYSPQEVNSKFEQADKQVSRLTRLVDDMLDVARINSGKLTLNTEQFSLAELAREVLDRMKSQFNSARMGMPELTVTGDPLGSWDRLRIEQVLINLLTNSIRYGAGKPVRVEIDVQGETVQLRVLDRGIDIAPLAQKKIFDRFERAINANEVSGLGLGLFITKQIVESHGGRIWVESELGQGSTFVAELPLVVSSVAASRATA